MIVPPGLGANAFCNASCPPAVPLAPKLPLGVVGMLAWWGLRKLERNLVFWV